MTPDYTPENTRLDFLVVDTVEGLTRVHPRGQPSSVWYFEDAEEAAVFINAWYAEDIRAMVMFDHYTERTFYDYTWIGG